MVNQQQFNDSSSDYSSETASADLKAFADTFKDAFTHQNNEQAIAPPQQQQQSKANNPFLMSPEQSKPSMGNGKSSYNINYDAFRDTFTSNEFNGIGQTESTPPMPQKPTISMDLFRDAAAAAFNEFGGGSTSNGKKKHEFFNKMPEVMAQNGKVMQWT